MHARGLDRRRLERFLSHFGAYPDQFRPLVWRYLAQLPENRAAYDAFVAQGPHPAYGDRFAVHFPIKSPQLASATQRVLSALAHWAPLFAHVEYLPHLVFPFVKVFARDTLSALEMVVTVIVNYCQKWWEYYPNPPLECLELVDDMLARFDPGLHAHLHAKARTGPQSYAWPILQSLFADGLGAAEWMRVWDHLLTLATAGDGSTGSGTKTSPLLDTSPRSASAPLLPPVYMYLFTVAYLRHFRVGLLQLRTADHVRDFVTTQRPSCVAAMLQSMHAMAAELQQGPSTATTTSTSTPATAGLIGQPLSGYELRLESEGMFLPYTPLPHVPTDPTAAAAAYPVFTGYPVAMVAYATKLHARLRADEAAYLRARRAARDLADLRSQLTADAKSWTRAETRAQAAMAAWWDDVLRLEARHLERARSARAAVRAQYADAMRAVVQARADAADQHAVSAHERGATLAKAAARAAALADVRARDAQEDVELDELKRQWDGRWRDLRRVRHASERDDRVRMGRLVEKLNRMAEMDGRETGDGGDMA
ncbi:TBC1 domain member 31 [Allomyces javanicus]|nr:TBC1 domain member 31 [Allomyces javanicus]